jgi:hypothetical protein
LDIETSPNQVHSWGLFNQNISLNQLIEPSYTLCWSAKWYREKEIMFMSIYENGSKMMTEGIHLLMEEADAIVTYNGVRFDIPVLNKDFILQGLAPTSPAKQVDLLKVCRKQFKFASNKLAYVAPTLGLGTKKTTTHDLWVKCMEADPVAWKKMKAYNIQDVRLLEKLYTRLRPWIKGHPNRSLFEADVVCPVCSSTSYQRRGYAYSQASKWARYCCNRCHSWFRGGRSLAKGPDDKFISI